MKTLPAFLSFALALTLAATLLAAPATQPAPGDPAAAPAVDASRGVAVAILDFDTKDPTNADLGKQIAEALTAILSGEPGFTLVERARLQDVLLEQELNLTGLVDTTQAVQVGKLVGARIIITGRAFPLGQKLFVTSKLIGTETSLVDGVLIQAKQDAELDAIVTELGAQLAQRLRDQSPKLLGGAEPVDPVPDLKKRLANRKLPKVAVIIPETHVAAARAVPEGQPPDPAVETEIKKILAECGVPVMDVKDNALTQWARDWTPERVGAWPRSLAGVDFVIAGEGFSEFGARLGNLVSCTGRAEINVIDRATGKVVLAERETARSVDLQENIAGKKALQKAGHDLAVKILRVLDETLPQAPR